MKEEKARIAVYSSGFFIRFIIFLLLNLKNVFVDMYFNYCGIKG